MLDANPHLEPLLRLAVALAVGLIVGFERGWYAHHPEAAHARGGDDTGKGDGDAISGIRTFALIGLFGGVIALLAEQTSPLLLLAAAVVVGAVAVAGYVVTSRRTGDVGATTEIGMVLVFALGAAAGIGFMLEAVAAAVVAALLLGLKAELHSTLAQLSRREVQASLQLLVAVAVVLPLLPDQSMGPWDSLNPRTLGYMVVLIAGVGFVGYFAVRVMGTRSGLLLTALFGGLTSSTAVTVAYARMARGGRRVPLIAAGIAIACGTMVPRVLIEVAAVNRDLLLPLLPGMGLLILVPALAAGWAVWRFGHTGDADELDVGNPLEIRKALLFGGILSVVFMLSHGAEAMFGDRGVVVLALLSGIADVDAVTLTLAAQAKGSLGASAAARGILLAAISNTAVKAVIAAVIGGGKLARWVTTYLLVAVVAAAATLWWI